jgi:O-antigen/teichoic acid export membrane protein
LAASTIAYGIVFIQNFSIAYFSSVNFFGRATLLYSLFSTLYIVFTCGLNGVVVRFFFDKKYNENQKDLISNVAALWQSFGMVLTVLLLVAGYFLLTWTEILRLDYFSEFVPIVVGAFLYSSTEIFPSVFIAKEKPLKYAGLLIASRGITFVLLHASLFFAGESASYMSLSLLASGVVMCVLIMIVTGAYKKSPDNTAYRREIFFYALPLMVYALGGIGYSHGYRVIISSWLSDEHLAIFTLASQVSLVYYLTASSSVTGFSPRAYKALEATNGDPRSIRFYIKLLLAVGVGTAFLVVPAAYVFLIYFKEGAFFESTRILPVLLIGQFFLLMYSYNYILCTFYKETRILTYAMVFGVATSLLLAFLLIKRVNLWGASVPVMCGLFIQFLVSMLLIRRVIRARRESGMIQLKK